jgi:hypothetical protein
MKLIALFAVATTSSAYLQGPTTMNADIMETLACPGVVSFSTILFMTMCTWYVLVSSNTSCDS